VPESGFLYAQNIWHGYLKGTVKKMLELNKLYNMDCIEGMKLFPDKYFELAIVDPEYGRKEHGGKNRSSFVKQKNGSSIYVNGNKYAKKNWDNKPAGEEYFNELFRVSQNQIIWGENYYFKNFGPGRIVWDKCNEGSDQSDCEIAYNSLTDRVDLIRYMWRGMMQGKSIYEGYIQQGDKSKNEIRIHPTQKPVKLYQWLLSKYAKLGDKIIDTHVGSASSLIAFYNMGFDHIGFEIDEEYFNLASTRIEEYQLQQRLSI
jgi:site-specific DNA-methyltransferase (adenine-specific)